MYVEVKDIEKGNVRPNKYRKMGEPITMDEFISRHKADLQQAGFDDQFASFVYFLLNIDGGDEIVYEKEDDIVVHRVDGCCWLIQVKHSVDRDTRMTDADSDFWKTIENWLSLYGYCNTDADKSNFLKMGNRFIIYTNKIVANTFAQHISALRGGDIEITEVQSFLQSIEQSVSYYSIVKRLLGLKIVELRKFLMRIEILESGDPLANLYNIFLQKFQNPTKADQIVNELLGKMLQEKKRAADNRAELKYLKEDFMIVNKGILNKVGDESLSALPYDEASILLPEDINHWSMVRQMEKIQVVDVSDPEDGRLITYYGFWYCCENSKQYYYSTQLMTPELEHSIDDKATKYWQISYNKSHQRVRSDSDNEIKKDAGTACFYEMMEKEIGEGLQKLQVPFSSGWFLNLSNQPSTRVHWHCDWESE